MRISIVIILCFFLSAFLKLEIIFAQPSPDGYDVQEIFATISATPEQINASDGTYAKYVLVRWMSPGSATGFQVYKSEDKQVAKAALINKETLKNSWILDYDVQPGVKYHYWVKAAYELEAVSSYSTSDEGFAANNENIALEEDATEAAINAPEKFTSNPFLEPMVNDTRSSDFSIEINTPKVNQSYTPSPDLMLEFNGVIESDELPQEQLLLHIYTNDKNSFIEDLTLVKTMLTPTKATDATDYTIQITIPFPYPSGLYYYTIQLAGEDDPIQVGKLLVE